MVEFPVEIRAWRQPEADNVASVISFSDRAFKECASQRTAPSWTFRLPELLAGC